MIIVYLFLTIIVLELGILIYLGFKKLPAEQQKELLRKVEPPKAEVMEWFPPKSEEEMAERTVRENL